MRLAGYLLPMPLKIAVEILPTRYHGLPDGL